MSVDVPDYALMFVGTGQSLLRHRCNDYLRKKVRSVDWKYPVVLVVAEVHLNDPLDVLVVIIGLYT